MPTSRRSAMLGASGDVRDLATAGDGAASQQHIVAEITQGKNKYGLKGAWEEISAAACATARYPDGLEQ
jgi:hypothetical protein